MCLLASRQRPIGSIKSCDVRILCSTKKRKMAALDAPRRSSLANASIFFVLDSLEGTHLPIARMQQERRILEELIHERTRELNHINTAWDEKIGLVLSAEA